MSTKEWRNNPENLEKIRATRRRWYKNHKKVSKEQIYKRREELKRWYKEYKSKLFCEKCGENHPAVLQFHHLDPTKKDMILSEVISNGWSIKRMLKEIEKCSVLCANCHFKLHYDESL